MSAASEYDLIVIGAGIVGLAHALSAVKRGRRVLVVDRDSQANGASVRNFGFVTVTGQQRGRIWRMARSSAAIWREIAPQAGITIAQQGLLMVAQSPEAAEVIEAFVRTEMGEGCQLLTTAEARACCPALRSDIAAALLSQADLRVESRTAIPLLARWLEQGLGVTFRRGTAAVFIEPGCVRLSDGTAARAPAIVACPGDDWASLFPEVYASARITRCQLQMMRLGAPPWRLPAPVMSDLSLVRYLGYAELPAAQALRQRLLAAAAFELEQGIHLIAVQDADGSLVVGDSHSYAPTPEPFASAAIDDAILQQFEALFGRAPPVIHRWIGSYASGPEHSIVRNPLPGVKLVVVTSGTGASTAFALAEQVIDTMVPS
jgi:FAD dependent oxidoreductase TIGR03364